MMYSAAVTLAMMAGLTSAATYKSGEIKTREQFKFGKFVANVLCILPADRYIRRRQACLAIVPHHKTTHEESVVPVVNILECTHSCKMSLFSLPPKHP